MIDKKDAFQELRKVILKEKIIVNELISLLNNLENVKTTEEKRMISTHVKSLKNYLKKTNDFLPKILEKLSLVRPLHPRIQKKSKIPDKPIDKQSKKPHLEKQP